MWLGRWLALRDECGRSVALEAFGLAKMATSVQQGDDGKKRVAQPRCEASDSMTHEHYPIVWWGEVSCVIRIYDQPREHVCDASQSAGNFWRKCDVQWMIFEPRYGRGHALHHLCGFRLFVLQVISALYAPKSRLELDKRDRWMCTSRYGLLTISTTRLHHACLALPPLPPALPPCTFATLEPYFRAYLLVASQRIHLPQMPSHRPCDCTVSSSPS